MTDVEWRGELVVAEYERAAGRATVDTVDEAVARARARAPVDTGFYRDQIHREGQGLEVDLVGGAPYSIWIEIGAQGRLPNPVLRRSGDEAFPHLAERIRREAGG